MSSGKKPGIAEHVNRYNAEALHVLPELSGLYDIIWIDADKPRTSICMSKPVYLFYVKVVGCLVDNVLWWGKVLPSHTEPDATAETMRTMASWLARRQDITHHVASDS